MISELIKSRDVAGLKDYMARNGLVLDGNRIVPRDAAAKAALLKQAGFWNQRQQAR